MFVGCEGCEGWAVKAKRGNWLKVALVLSARLRWHVTEQNK